MGWLLADWNPFYGFSSNTQEFFPNGPGSLRLQFMLESFSSAWRQGEWKSPLPGIRVVRWDGKENMVRPGAPLRWDTRENGGPGWEGGQSRVGEDPPRCPGEEELSTAGLRRGACGDSRPRSQPWGGQSKAGSASSQLSSQQHNWELADQLEPPHLFQISSKRGFGLIPVQRRIPKSDV